MWSRRRPKNREKRQYQTVISDFGRALVRVLSPPAWSWILTAAWGAGCRPKGVKRGGQSGWSGTQGSPARHFWRIAVVPQTQILCHHPLQALFFGHHWVACDHPCALVSGVGPCLHLCALCNMEHRIWYMEYGIWNVEHGIFNMELGVRTVESGEHGVCSMRMEYGLKSMVWSMEDGG